MKIKLQAIEWAVGHGIKFDEFFAHLRAWAIGPDAKPKEFKHRAKERVIVVEKVDDFWLIVILSERDQRATFRKHKDAEGRISIHPTPVVEGAQDVDFNYLLCHRESGRGVYAHYHQSCGFEDLTNICRDVYRGMRETRVNAMAAAEGGGEEALSKAGKHYQGILRGIVLVSPQEIGQLIEQMNALSSLEMVFGEVQVSRGWGQPLAGTVDVAKHVFRFKANLQSRSIKDKVIAAIKKAKPRRGKVVGTLEGGIEQVYNISRNAGTYAEMDFDRVVSQLKIDLERPAESVIVTRMREAIQQRPNYFVKHKRPKKKKAGKPKAAADTGAGPAAKEDGKAPNGGT